MCLLILWDRLVSIYYHYYWYDLGDMSSSRSFGGLVMVLPARTAMSLRAPLLCWRLTHKSRRPVAPRTSISVRRIVQNAEELARCCGPLQCEHHFRHCCFGWYWGTFIQCFEGWWLLHRFTLAVHGFRHHSCKQTHSEAAFLFDQCFGLPPVGRAEGSY